jgi:hypothetical protein
VDDVVNGVRFTEDEIIADRARFSVPYVICSRSERAQVFPQSKRSR